MRLPLHVAVKRDTRFARLFCRGDVVALTLHPDGRLGIERTGGMHDVVSVDTSTTVYSFLVVLRYQLGDRVESLVIPCAATGEAAHRRLRVWLRCRAKTGVSAWA